VGIKEKKEDLEKYRNEFKIASPILIDEDGKVANSYGVWSHPETFLINRDRKIVGRVLKRMDWASKTIRDLIQYLLGEKNESKKHTEHPLVGEDKGEGD